MGANFQWEMDMLISNKFLPANVDAFLNEMAMKNIPIKDAILVHNTMKTGLCKAGDLEKVQEVNVRVGYELIPT
jgi:hypothetical protein